MPWWLPGPQLEHEAAGLVYLSQLEHPAFEAAGLVYLSPLVLKQTYSHFHEN